MSENQPEPFVGPQPLGAAHTIYGRDLEISELRYYLGAKRIVLLSSPSGAGKSSLLKAKNGLMAKLRDSERFDVWGDARVNQMPGGAGNRFSQSLMQGWGDAAPDLTLTQYAGQRRRGLSPLVVVDQFEEVLRLDPADTRAKHAFFDELGNMLDDARIWALFVIREDYLAALTPYLRQLPTHLNHQYRIDFLRREDQALEAFTKPLAGRGRTFAPGVAESVLRDLAMVRGQTEPGQHVEPLQLQVVGQNLWRRIVDRPSNQPIEADDAGDVTCALAQYYRERVKRPDADLERQVRNWVGDQLINPAGYRNLVRQEQEQTAGLAQDEINALCDAYLVRREFRAGATWLELAHDRLVEPVRVNNAEWEEDTLSPLQRAAELWRDNQRQEGFLISGAALTAAAEEASERKAKSKTIMPEESEFLAGSFAMQRRQRWKRMAVIALVALLLASVAAGWFAWDQKSQAEAATREVKVGLARFQVQNAARFTYAHQPGSALAYLAAALRMGSGSPEAEFWSGALLNRANIRLPFREVKLFPETITTLAVSGDGRLVAAANRVGDVRVWSVAEGREVGKTFRSQWGAKKMAFHPDGERLLVMPGHQEDFGAHVWSWRTGEKLFTTSDGLQSADFSADGARIETVSISDERELWDAATGKRMGNWKEATAKPAEVMRAGEEFTVTGGRLLLRGEPVVATGGALAAYAYGGYLGLVRLEPDPPVEQDLGAPVDGVAYAASGDLLVATETGIWRQKPGGAREAILRERPAGGTLGFSAGGQWLVEPQRLWNIASGRPMDLPAPQLKTASQIAFNTAGDRMVIVTGGKVTMWRIGEGKTPERVWQRPNPNTGMGERGALGSAAFTPDGVEVLVWGGYTLDGPARPEVWNAADGVTVRTVPTAMRFPESNQQFLAAYSSDGSRLAVASPYENNVEVYDTRSWLSIGKPLRHEGRVRALAFGRGLLVLTQGDPASGPHPWHRLQSWEVATGTMGGDAWRVSGTGRLALMAGDRRVAVAGHLLAVHLVTPEIGGPEEAGAMADLAEAVCGCRLENEVIEDLPWEERQVRLKSARGGRSAAVRALVETFTARAR